MASLKPKSGPSACWRAKLPPVPLASGGGGSKKGRRLTVKSEQAVVGRMRGPGQGGGDRQSGFVVTADGLHDSDRTSRYTCVTFKNRIKAR